MSYIRIADPGTPLTKEGEKHAYTIIDGEGNDALTPQMKKKMAPFLERFGRAITPPSRVGVGQTFRSVRYRSRKHPEYKKECKVLAIHLVGNVPTAVCEARILVNMGRFWSMTSRGIQEIPISDLGSPERYLLVQWPAPR